MSHRNSTVVLVALAVLSCSQVRRDEAKAVTDSAQSSSGGFVDTERDIEPTPRENTELGLRVLQKWVEAHRVKHGRLPDSLQAIIPPDPDDPNFLPHDRYHRDGWNRPFIYVWTGPSYELRSLGADGNPSADDLVVISPRERVER